MCSPFSGHWSVKEMNRFRTKGPTEEARPFSAQIAEAVIRAVPTNLEEAADTLRLRGALRRAVAKSDAPAYLIDAIRREIRK